MDDKRRLIRLEVKDFLQITPLNREANPRPGKSKDITSMGICFSSPVQWDKGEVLFIDYFMRDELESAQIKVEVIWSEFIDSDQGYFCGGQIIEIEPAKEELFANYYSQKIRKKSA